MFIVICQDVIEKSINSSSTDNSYAVDALKKVLLSVKWCKHVVFAPKLREEDISRLENILTKEEVSLLAFVHSKRLDLNSLMNRLSIIAYITFKAIEKKDNRIIVINPKHYKSFELYEETHFIVENILDSVFYKNVVCKYYQKINKLPPQCYSVEFYPVQGGGSTISEVLKYEIDKMQHFCLVIVDSDKKSINDRKEGDTAKGIRSVVLSYKKKTNQLPFNVDYYIMSKTREIENLIPKCILDIFSNKSQREFLEKHNKSLAFFDFKLGMEYKMLYNNDVRRIWKIEFPDDIEWEQIDAFKAASKDQVDFEAKLKEQKLSIIFEGWGKNILNTVLNPVKKKHQDLIYKLYEINETELTQYQKYEWENIGKNVFSWCCCFRKTVI